MTEFQLHSRFVPEFTWEMQPTSHPSAKNRQALRRSATRCACCGEYGKLSHRARAGFSCSCTFGECESERCYKRFQHAQSAPRQLGLVNRLKSDASLGATGCQFDLETPAELDDRRVYVEPQSEATYQNLYTDEFNRRRVRNPERPLRRRWTPVKAVALLLAAASSESLTISVGTLVALFRGEQVVDRSVELDFDADVRWCRRVEVLVDLTNWRVRATDRSTGLLLTTQGFASRAEAVAFGEELKERCESRGDHVGLKRKQLPLRRLIVVNQKQRRITVKLDRKGGRTLGTKRYADDAQLREAYRRIVAQMDAQGKAHRTWLPAGTKVAAKAA